MKLQRLILLAACVLLILNLDAQDKSDDSSGVSVHFAFDKYDINATDLAAIQDFRQTYPDIISIYVDGYADSVGTVPYNYALSMRRCNAVKQALGYDTTKTEILTRTNAHGEVGLLFKTNPENRVVMVAVNWEKVRAQQKAKEEQAALTAKPAEPVKEEVKPDIKKDTIAKVVKPKPKEFGEDESGLLKQLKNSKVGESIILSGILFKEASHELLKSSKPSLNVMLEALKELPTLQMEIQGHMCCDDALTIDGFDIDSKEFRLSYNRAKSVFDYMVQNGVDPSRLSYKGFGTRKRLIEPEKTDNDRSKNRRVQFLITKE